ncbi:MAG: oligopeptide transporter, OPT family [Deltaproteobacteria bacterium CG07_land_8_20_14_0_80_38_7]|nr:MAG: oligopeptide transporter, OPT family [Deltaproteobacteria bacterium CG07_land_8_20_14_0_80_38_7]
MSEFQPYVPPESNMKEFTLRVAVFGAIFGIIFGSANAYLGLRVGLTISTSIPIAVITVAVCRLLAPVWGKSTILQYINTQTIGSASSSLASGIIFTIPALFLWGMSPSIARIGAVAMLGGLLGVLFMIPLRKFLIVKEHATLPYPEGLACAEVLKAADRGGARARPVFIGLGIGAVYKAIVGFLKLWPDSLTLKLPILKNAQIGLEATPALIGVGYILGFRIAGIMVAGGLLSWVVLIPLISFFGAGLTAPIFPETVKTIAEMNPAEIWTRYIRHIGAGAVAFAGIITVCKSFKIMYSSLQAGIRELKERSAGRQKKLRTDTDLPIYVILFGVIIVVLIIAIVPHVLGNMDFFSIRLISAICIAFFSFIFVTVASRIVGLVGVTSNPTSGMIIVTLLGTSLIFYLLGWTDRTGMATALVIGTIVGISASISGDVSQDLKAGYLLGATPMKQQIGEMIGVVASAFFIAWAVWLLGATFGFGSQELPAPQATLMKTVVEGVLQANLPWALVLTGAALAAVAELLGVPSLPFAVGIYLPLSTMTPVFVGGCIRRIVEAKRKRDMEKKSIVESAEDRGVLLGSGLIAGEGLIGIVVAIYAFYVGKKPAGIDLGLSPFMSEMVSLAAFMLLGWFIYHIASKKSHSLKE